jgi:hypothetical protein
MKKEIRIFLLIYKVRFIMATLDIMYQQIKKQVISLFTIDETSQLSA